MILLDSKRLADLGIVDFGYTSEATPVSLNHYNNWVREKNHLPLTYLEGARQEKRQSIKEHWPEFQSAVVFLFSYHDGHQKLLSFYQKDKSWNGLRIASYTLGFKGLDYHHEIRERLILIGESLKSEDCELEYRLTLDTQPVLERDLAMRAGIGWFGKNSMLINRNHGSFFIIGSLLLNKNIMQEVVKIETDHCGQCTRCIDACPTEAIDVETRTIKASDCISTFTIEQFRLDTVPSSKMTLKEGTIFGCDICQDICPWNTRIDRQNTLSDLNFQYEDQNKIIDFFLKKDVSTLAKNLDSLTEGSFKRLFRNTSLERSGRRGLYKNVLFYLKELLLS